MRRTVARDPGGDQGRGLRSSEEGWPEDWPPTGLAGWMVRTGVALGRRPRHRQKGYRREVLRRAGPPPGVTLLLAGTVAGLVVVLRYHPMSMAANEASMQGSAPAPMAVVSGARTVTGKSVDTDFGPMQVQITIAGGRITATRAVRLTDAGQTSVRINQRSLPILYAEALKAQGARIDSVSGASVTSDGYKRALQSAIDMAHLA